MGGDRVNLLRRRRLDSCQLDLRELDAAIAGGVRLDACDSIT
jgi:hypothetical protein